jgi:hypothetical protein
MEDHKSDNHHKELLNRLNAIEDRFTAIEQKLDPMYQIFDSVSGFNNIAVWILKALILFGAGIAVIVGAIKYLKN